MLGGAREWLRYRHGAFGNPLEVWDSGPDFGALRRRWSEDAVYVEAMLALGLAARDPFAAAALTTLPLSDDSRARFKSLLTACLGLPPIGFHLRAVEALYALTEDESWSIEVVRVLLGAGFWGDRYEAARLLGGFRPTYVLIAAVAQAVEDPDYLVRRQAVTVLLRFGGRDGGDESIAQPLSRIRTGMPRAEWAAAAVELAGDAAGYARCASTLPSRQSPTRR